MSRSIALFVIIFFFSPAWADTAMDAGPGEQPQGNSEEQVVWIDVRSDEEYSQDYIEGDIHIPHEQIVAAVEKMFPDKSTEIHLYCRSGRRAGIAMDSLSSAGYTNVINAGGIDDARMKRKL